MNDQLPPSYWIDQIRADLARRRAEEDADHSKSEPTTAQTTDPNGESR